MSANPRTPFPLGSVVPLLRRSVAVATVCVAASGCAGDGDPDPAPSTGGAEAPVETPSGGGERPEFGYAGPVGEARERLEAAREEAAEPEGEGALAAETEADWAILRETLAWAREQALQRLPTGEIMAIVGTTFVGTPYVPHTLELEGPERLVVNLRALDCVTFVEHMLAMAHLLRTMPDDLLERDEEELRRRYRSILTRIRYRGGELDGYPSRLHYFSDWIRDNEEVGLVANVTGELGGEPDERPIHFMSSNVDSYRQLEESEAALAAVAEKEAELNERVRLRIPQERLADVVDELRNGDIVATTSTVDGLDVAHTGLVLRHGGRVHLLHAPLVGESVEISERPLPERILGLSAQDGVMVARPLEETR